MRLHAFGLTKTMMDKDKPKIGEPCNGCGLCCKLFVCHTGAFMLGLTKYPGEKRLQGPCPALTQRSDDSYGCGIVMHPEKFLGKTKYRPEVISKHMMVCIGSGDGCDEIGYDEGNEEEEAKLEAFYQKHVNDKDFKKQAANSISILMKVKDETKKGK